MNGKKNQRKENPLDYSGLKKVVEVTEELSNELRAFFKEIYKNKDLLFKYLQILSKMF